MDRIDQFNKTNVTTLIVGRYSGYCHTNLYTPYINMSFDVSCTNPSTQSKYEISLIVTATIENVIIRDYYNIHVTRIKKGIYKEIFILDGTPGNTTIGQLEEYSDSDTGLLNLEDNHDLIGIGEFGNIYTKIDVNIDDYYNCTVIANSEKFNISYDKKVVGEIKATFLRRQFIGRPLLEDSSPDTAIAYLYLQSQFEIIHEAGFHFNKCALLLGTTVLNYSVLTEITETITFRFNETDYNVTIMFKVIDVNNNAPYFLQDSYEFTVVESADIGNVVGVVRANDSDSDSTLKYTISDNHTLAIDDYGVITQQGELISSFDTSVTVYDGRYSISTEIGITVKKQDNDHAVLSLKASLKENVNTTVIKSVFIGGFTDYKFANADSSSKFIVDPQSVSLYTCYYNIDIIKTDKMVVTIYNKYCKTYHNYH